MQQCYVRYNIVKCTAKSDTTPVQNGTSNRFLTSYPILSRNKSCIMRHLVEKWTFTKVYAITIDCKWTTSHTMRHQIDFWLVTFNKYNETLNFALQQLFLTSINLYTVTFYIVMLNSISFEAAEKSKSAYTRQPGVTCVLAHSRPLPPWWNTTEANHMGDPCWNTTSGHPCRNAICCVEKQLILIIILKWLVHNYDHIYYPITCCINVLCLDMPIH